MQAVEKRTWLVIEHFHRIFVHGRPIFIFCSSIFLVRSSSFHFVDLVDLFGVPTSTWSCCFIVHLVHGVHGVHFYFLHICTSSSRLMGGKSVQAWRQYVHLQSYLFYVLYMYVHGSSIQFYLQSCQWSWHLFIFLPSFYSVQILVHLLLSSQSDLSCQYSIRDRHCRRDVDRDWSDDDRRSIFLSYLFVHRASWWIVMLYMIVDLGTCFSLVAPLVVVQVLVQIWSDCWVIYIFCRVQWSWLKLTDIFILCCISFSPLFLYIFYIHWRSSSITLKIDIL